MSMHDLSTLIQNSRDLEWVQNAACGTLELEQLELFFVDAGRTLSREAAAICAECDVRPQCLEHAYDHEIAGGYFGGVSPSKRRALPRDEAVALLDAD